MNKYKNALNKLKNYEVNDGSEFFGDGISRLDEIFKKEFITLQELVDKETPKVPELTAIYNGYDIYAFDVLLCPNCERDLYEDIRHNQALTYCPYCGQSLKTKVIIFTNIEK